MSIDTSAMELVEILRESMPAPYVITSAVIGNDRIVIEVRDLTSTHGNRHDDTRPPHDVTIADGVVTGARAPKRVLAAVIFALTRAETACAA